MGTTRERLATHLPVFGLEVRTPRLTLRYPDDDDLLALLERVEAGVHDPATMPFTIGWTDVPEPHRSRNTLAFFWSQRITCLRDDWQLPLVVVIDGVVSGTQNLMATRWSTLRSIGTGSWLGQDLHGQRLGREMRAAALHLAFAGFGAQRATTAAWHDNAASLGVTRSLGYRPDGEDVLVRRGVADRMLRYALEREDWEPHRRHDIELVGVDAVLDVFGSDVPPVS